jgi:Fic family protein
VYVAPAPQIQELLEGLPAETMADTIAAPFGGPKADDQYLHWDKLRRLEPPAELGPEQWWLRLKLARASETRRFPLLGVGGDSFGFTLPDLVLRYLHRIDQRGGGEVAMDEVVISEEQARERFLVNSLIEEAIRSSQLEGATTSRRVAKELLRSGREPRNRSERMIANNYRAIQFMREEMNVPLTPDAVLELQRILTEGTLDDPNGAGRLQRPGEDRVAVYDRDDDQTPIHLPPPAEELPRRLDLLCAFANEAEGGKHFVHPVVRSILLHFWLAYDHPFVDGNGRTARILFFWSMRRRGYWLAEYLPISRFIRKAPSRYARAFVESETDGGDTTYFLIHQLKVIDRAIDDVHAYVQRKTAEVRDIQKLLHGDDDLNGRQLALLTDAVRHSDAAYSFDSHARSHRVTHETARSDLGQLADRGLLVRHRKGRKYWFEPARDLIERLRESRR